MALLHGIRFRVRRSAWALGGEVFDQVSLLMRLLAYWTAGASHGNAHIDMVADIQPGLIPDDLLARLEAATGASVVGVVPRAGGGASRKGAEISLRQPGCRTGGGEQRCYLSYDTRLGDPTRVACFRREVAILRALSGELAGAGVRAPRFLAADIGHLALLTALVPGSDKYPASDAPPGLGRDFMAQLAALHRIDPRCVVLDGFGDPGVAVSVRIRDRIGSARRENLATAPDAILLLALDWLAANIPPDHGPAVIVHGDSGPGNFLHEDGRVTALLDWELCHFGDPAEDLAQIWVRSLFQPFLPPRAMFSAYEEFSGTRVEADRVRYHRLYFQAGFMVSSHAMLYGTGGMRPAAMGVSMLFHTAHRRVMVQSLAELAGVTLGDVALPETAPGWRDRTFEIALEDIREVIAPRASDQLAAVKAKSLARMIKFWRARDRHGAVYDEAERAEISAALGGNFASLALAQAALAQTVADRAIGFETALALCHARVTRETALMGDALGSFRDTYFPQLI